MTKPVCVSATLTFYSIILLGYRKRTNTRKSAKVTDMALKTMEDLGKFASDPNIRIGDTATFEANDSAGQTYLLGAHQQGDAWLVATWTRHQGDGNIGLVSASTPPSAPQVKSRAFGTDQIPGYPSYFLVMPKEGYVATVSFRQGRVTGLPGFRHYIKGYIESRASWVKKSAHGDVVSYGDLDASEHDAYCDLKLETTPADTDALVKQWQKVYKLVKRQKLSAVRGEDIGLLQRMFAMCGLPEKLPEHQKEFPLSFELNYKPSSQEEFLSLVKSDSHGRIGFRLSDRGPNNPAIMWADKCYRRFAVELDVERINGSHVLCPKSIGKKLADLRNQYHFWRNPEPHPNRESSDAIKS